MDEPAEFLNSLPGIQFRLDEAGNIQFISPNVRERLGHSPEELTGQPFGSIVVEDSLKRPHDSPVDSILAEDASPEDIDIEGADILRVNLRFVFGASSEEVPGSSRPGTVTGESPNRTLPFNVFLSPERDGDTVIRWNGTMVPEEVKGPADAERELSEQFLRETDTGVFMLRPDLPNASIVYMNQALSDLTGYDRSGLMGQGLDVLAGEDTDFDRLKPGLQGDESLVEKIQFYRKNGKPFEAEIQLKSISAFGDRSFVTGMLTDVTERVEVQQALKESQQREERLRKIAESTGQVFFLVPASMDRFLYLSSTAETLWGIENAKLQSDPLQLLDSVRPEDRKEFQELLEGERELPAQAEYRVEVGGDSRWLATRISSVDEETGQMIAGVTMDVTERKHREEELRESERKFRSITENLDQVIWLTDPNFEQIEYVSPLVEEWFGVSPEELAEDNYVWLNRIHPEDLPRLQENLQKNVIEAETPEEYQSEETAFRVKREDGGWRWCYSENSPIVGDDGNVEKIVGFITDVTDQRQRERELQDAQEELEQALQQKNVLLKEVHHRVKNNLQVISAMLRLQGEQIDDPKTNRKLNESLNRIQSMAMTHELLYQSDRFEEIRIEKYVDELINHLRESFQRDVGSVEFELNIDDIGISLDTAISCGLILNELITNSLQHGFGPEEQGHVTIDFEQLDEKYRLTVRDDGPGFPEGFDPATSESLGYQLIEALVSGNLEGNLRVENHDGAEVRVEIPSRE